MIRYRLLEPKRQWRPERGPRREAFVSMDAEYCDQQRPYRLKGDPALVAEIAEAIPRMRGFEGRSIGDGNTTARDLCYCFYTAFMARYEPEIVEGKEVLEKQEPPSEFTFHRILAGFLASTLPRNAVANEMGTEQELDELAFQWPYWRREHPDAEEAAAALAALLVPEIRSEFQFPHFLRMSREEPGRPPPLFSAEISEEQGLMLARVLVECLDRYDARELTGQQLLDTMRERVEALGLPPAR